jgi:hypothetical protein
MFSSTGSVKEHQAHAVDEAGLGLIPAAQFITNRPALEAFRRLIENRKLLQASLSSLFSDLFLG